jgi:pimeloyl-ACP methyl ester carboxylesterase
MAAVLPEPPQLFHVVLRATSAMPAGDSDPPALLRVVLLHGWLQDCTCWLQVASALRREGHDVLLLDWPHHGHSPSAAELGVEMSPCGWLSALEALLIQLGWDSGPPLALAGCSLGGALSLRYAVLRPDRVARLTLVAPAGLPEPAWNAPFHLASSLVKQLPHPIFNVTRTTPTYGLTPQNIASVAIRLGPSGAMRVVVAAYDLVHSPHWEFWTSLLPAASVTMLPRTSHWWACTHLFGLRLHEEPEYWGRTGQPRRTSRL